MQAKYIVFNSNSKAYVSGGEVRYYLSEASARCLDKEIHSIAKINYKRRSLMEAFADKENTDRVKTFDDEDSFWDCICQYIDNATLFIVWDDDERTIKNNAKLRNKKIRIRGLKAILNSMLMNNNVNTKSLIEVSELISVTFDVLQTSEQPYVTGFYTKLFRKMVKIGKIQNERFEELIYLNDLNAISKKTYFRIKTHVLEEQPLKEEQESHLVEQIIADLRLMGITTIRKDNYLYVETDIATWWFDYGLKDNTLHYMTKKFYTGNRTMLVEGAIPEDYHARNTIVVNMIHYKEDRLRQGVGNTSLTKYVQILADSQRERVK